jgi:hypothetical protein
MARSKNAAVARFELLDLGGIFNNTGTTNTGSGGLGFFNVWQNSLAAEGLPHGQITVGGIEFGLPGASRRGHGQPDNVRCDRQYVGVPPGRYDWLYLLAAAERRAEDELAFHFSTGDVDFETLRVSDFWAAEPAFGEPLGFESGLMHYPRHVQRGVPGRVWLERVPVPRMTRLTGFQLPQNVAIHIFAATLDRTPAGRPQELRT